MRTYNNKMTCYKDGWRSKISWRSLYASGKMYKRERGTKSSSFFKYQLSPQFKDFIDFPRMPMNHRKRTQESWVPATLTNFSKHPPAPRKAGWYGNHTHVHLHAHTHTHARVRHTHACTKKPTHQQVNLLALTEHLLHAMPLAKFRRKKYPKGHRV